MAVVAVGSVAYPATSAIHCIGELCDQCCWWDIVGGWFNCCYQFIGGVRETVIVSLAHNFVALVLLWTSGVAMKLHHFWFSECVTRVVQMIVQTIVQIILFGMICSVRKKDLPVIGLIPQCYLEIF